MIVLQNFVKLFFFNRSGRPMKIEIATAAPGRMIESRRLGNFRNRSSRGAGGGGGRRRFSKYDAAEL